MAPPPLPPPSLPPPPQPSPPPPPAVAPPELLLALALTRGPAGAFVLGWDNVVDLGILSDDEAVGAAVVHTGSRVAAGSDEPTRVSLMRVPFLYLSTVNVGLVIATVARRGSGGSASMHAQTRHIAMGRYALDAATGEMLSVVPDIRPGGASTVSLVWMGPPTCEFVRERVDVVCNLGLFTAGRLAESILSLERTTRVGGDRPVTSLPNGPRDFRHLVRNIANCSGPTQEFVGGVSAFREHLILVDSNDTSHRLSFMETAAQCRMAGLRPQALIVSMHAELLEVGLAILGMRLRGPDDEGAKESLHLGEAQSPRHVTSADGNVEKRSPRSEQVPTVHAFLGFDETSLPAAQLEVPIAGSAQPRAPIRPSSVRESAFRQADAGPAPKAMLEGIVCANSGQAFYSAKLAPAVTVGKDLLGSSFPKTQRNFSGCVAKPAPATAALAVPPGPGSVVPLSELSFAGAAAPLASPDVRKISTLAPATAPARPAAAAHTSDEKRVLRRARNIEAAKRSNARRRVADAELKLQLDEARMRATEMRRRESALRRENVELRCRLKERTT
jgi:hypothetical protein